MLAGDSNYILVTGGAGFIGSRLAEVLAEKGRKVLIVDNLNDYYDPRLKTARLKRLGIPYTPGKSRFQSSIFPNLEFRKLDITDRPALQKLFENERFEAVMNLAAQAGVRYSIENPYSYIENNISGFLNLLECARHFPVKRFVYASSSSVYGGNEKTPFSEEDNVDNPVSLYAATKKSNEVMARAYRNLYGVPAVGLRFFTVYGPWGRPDMAPMLFASAISKGEPIKVFNNGDMKRDFTYVDDIVDGIIKVIDGSESLTTANDIYNIGRGEPVDLMEFISILEEELSVEAVKDYLPMQKGDVKITYADTSKLKKDYGYAPATSLRQGVKTFAEWFKSELNPLK